MDAFDNDLRRRLEELRTNALLRELRRIESPQGPSVQWGGQTLLNFCSNDYLGLANHPALKEAATRAIADWGAGSGASRLICGSLGVHHELEERLARFKGTPAALCFSTGYAAAIGTITALLAKTDFLLVDKLVHACVVDAARLSEATLRVFRHNDLEDLETKLRWADAQRVGAGPRRPRVLIVTESVFSMDGDLAPLRDMVELKDRHDAWLMVDEAHATGLFGQRRRGLVEEFGLSGRIEIQMGTLGKALGAAGGYIAGSRPLIEILINRARTFIFSTGPTPAQSAAASAAIQLIQAEEGESLRQRCWANVDAAKNAVINAGFSLPPVQSPILPLLVGDEAAAVTLSTGLRERGVLIPAIRYPTVARGAARLRLTTSAAHGDSDLRALGEALAEAHRAMSAPNPQV